MKRSNMRRLPVRVVDYGGVWALHTAGWKPSAISFDRGLNDEELTAAAIRLMERGEVDRRETGFVIKDRDREELARAGGRIIDQQGERGVYHLLLLCESVRAGADIRELCAALRRQPKHVRDFAPWLFGEE